MGYAPLEDDRRERKTPVGGVPLFPGLQPVSDFTPGYFSNPFLNELLQVTEFSSIESTYFQFSNSKLSHSLCHMEGNLCMLKSTKTNAGMTSVLGTRWIWVIQSAHQGVLTPGCSDQWLEVLGQTYNEVKSTLVNVGFTLRLWNVLMLWFLEGCTHHGQKRLWPDKAWSLIPGEGFHTKKLLSTNLIHSEIWWFPGLKEWEGCSENPHLQIIRTMTSGHGSSNVLWNQMSDFYLCEDCDRRCVCGQVWSMLPLLYSLNGRHSMLAIPDIGQASCHHPIY